MTTKQAVGSTAPDGSKYVTITDGAGALGNTNISSVKTDQTTPGTTDLVTTRFQRRQTLSFTFVPGTSYTVGKNIGGLFTLSGMPISTQVLLGPSRVVVTAASVSAAGSIPCYFFSANPASSTFTDAMDGVLHADDAAKFIAAVNMTSTTGGLPSVFWIGNANQTATTDSSGRLWVALQSQATITIGTPTHFEYRQDVFF